MVAPIKTELILSNKNFTANLNAAVRQSASQTKKMNASFLSTNRVVRGLAASLAGLFTLRVARSFIEMGASIERTKLSIDALTGSIKSGDRAFRNIQILARDLVQGVDEVTAGFRALEVQNAGTIDNLEAVANVATLMDRSVEDVALSLNSLRTITLRTTLGLRNVSTEQGNLTATLRDGTKVIATNREEFRLLLLEQFRNNPIFAGKAREANISFASAVETITTAMKFLSLEIRRSLGPALTLISRDFDDLINRMVLFVRANADVISQKVFDGYNRLKDIFFDIRDIINSIDLKALAEITAVVTVLSKLGVFKAGGLGPALNAALVGASAVGAGTVAKKSLDLSDNFVNFTIGDSVPDLPVTKTLKGSSASSIAAQKVQTSTLAAQAATVSFTGVLKKLGATVLRLVKGSVVLGLALEIVIGLVKGLGDVLGALGVPIPDLTDVLRGLGLAFNGFLLIIEGIQVLVVNGFIEIFISLGKIARGTVAVVELLTRALNLLPGDVVDDGTIRKLERAGDSVDSFINRLIEAQDENGAEFFESADTLVRNFKRGSPENEALVRSLEAIEAKLNSDERPLTEVNRLINEVVKGRGFALTGLTAEEQFRKDARTTAFKDVFTIIEGVEKGLIKAEGSSEKIAKIFSNLVETLAASELEELAEKAARAQDLAAGVQNDLENEAKERFTLQQKVNAVEEERIKRLDTLNKDLAAFRELQLKQRSVNEGFIAQNEGDPAFADEVEARKKANAKLAEFLKDTVENTAKNAELVETSAAKALEDLFKTQVDAQTRLQDALNQFNIRNLSEEEKPFASAALEFNKIVGELNEQLNADIISQEEFEARAKTAGLELQTVVEAEAKALKESRRVIEQELSTRERNAFLLGEFPETLRPFIEISNSAAVQIDNLNDKLRSGTLSLEQYNREIVLLSKETNRLSQEVIQGLRQSFETPAETGRREFEQRSEELQLLQDRGAISPERAQQEQLKLEFEKSLSGANGALAQFNADVTSNAAEGLENGIASGLQNAIEEGSFEDFAATLGEAVRESLVRAVADALAKQAVQGLISAGLSLGSLFGGAATPAGPTGTTGAGLNQSNIDLQSIGLGGSLNLQGVRTGGTVLPQGIIRRFATGGIVPDISNRPFADSVPALLQPGEKVLTRNEVRNQKEGQESMNVNLTFNLQSLDPSRAADVIKQQGAAIEDSLIDRVQRSSKLRKALGR